mmetsp:Transcript_87227/g.244793  ORF Transcript_87227/g.244793 Transcript_87227/m.244793 type:complete len:246 (-) Transcript_87227:312-1049(-)
MPFTCNQNPEVCAWPNGGRSALARHIGHVRLARSHGRTHRRWNLCPHAAMVATALTSSLGTGSAKLVQQMAQDRSLEAASSHRTSDSSMRPVSGSQAVDASAARIATMTAQAATEHVISMVTNNRQSAKMSSQVALRSAGSHHRFDSACCRRSIQPHIAQPARVPNTMKPQYTLNQGAKARTHAWLPSQSRKGTSHGGWSFLCHTRSARKTSASAKRKLKAVRPMKMSRRTCKRRAAAAAGAGQD